LKEISFLNLIKRHTKYDFVFISAIPAFYKINLFNKLNSRCKVLVVFLGSNSSDRTKDFVNGDILFDIIYLTQKEFEFRNKVVTTFKFILILFFVEAKLIGVGSWAWPESWAAIFISKKFRNVLTLESSIFESKLNGIYLSLKKIFVKRIKFALVSGEPHLRLMRAIGFPEKCIVTGGVGLAYRHRFAIQTNKIFHGKFLYVGRLSPEKNLIFLINAFRHQLLNSFNLTIVGSGPLKNYLRSIAPLNVTFIEHLPNEKIHQAYLEHDVFILPSISEPWGIVVEEALYYGLPVISSSMVGSVEDLIVKNLAGMVFDPYSQNSLLDAILKISNEYGDFISSVRNIDFNARDCMQVQSYLSVLTEVGE
jgi:glycosyltransferase involved in cell wall biosynthesis